MTAEDGEKLIAIPVIIGTEVREILVPYDATQPTNEEGIEKFKRMVVPKYTEVGQLVDEILK